MTTPHPPSPDDSGRARTGTPPTGYPRESPSQTEIRIKGRLSAALVASLGELGTEVLPVETVLRGDIDDAALFALIDRVGELGLELLEVRRFAPGGQDVAARG
jgi:hypothetical protein